MKKYKKAAINIAFLTVMLSAGLMGSYTEAANNEADLNWNNNNRPRPVQKRREMIMAAFENSDYQAWKKMIGNKVSGISETAFQRFVIARTAARNGEYVKAIKITEQLKKELTSG